MNVKISIEFCMMWNYAPKAASFAEQLFNHFRHQITEINLIPGAKGSFEVVVNGTKLYSKLDTGEFPAADEMIKKIEKKFS